MSPEEPKKTVPWYEKTSVVVIALLSVGPFALPLLWVNPRYSTANKVLWTLVTIGATFLLVTSTVTSVQKIMQQYKELGLMQ